MSASAILRLQAAGFSAEQVTAIADLIDTQSATKADLEGSEHRLELKIDAVDRRLDLKVTALQGGTTLLKWMMDFVLAFQAAIFAKLFCIEGKGSIASSNTITPPPSPLFRPLLA